jgi:hypothetical protein
VTLAVEVEAVGFEGIAEGTDGTALVVVATQRPEGLVLVGRVSAQVDDPSGVEFGVDSVEENLVAVAGFSSRSLAGRKSSSKTRLKRRIGSGNCRGRER